MSDRLLLICEGPNDEAVGGKLVERFAGEPGVVWDWAARTGRSRAFLYWQEWKDDWKRQPRRMRGTLSMPEPIKRLRKNRGEAVMAIKVVHIAQREYPSSPVILMRDSDGKEQRVEAWSVFQQVQKDVAVGIAEKSIEAWVLACWTPDEKEISDASAWVKQERGSEFDPFREPDRLAPSLSKRLLEYLNCVCSDDYAEVVSYAADAQLRSKPAERAGLSHFVEQIDTKLSHLIAKRPDAD